MTYNKSTQLVLKYEELCKDDVAIVGGKNANLGEMINHLTDKVRVPTGFATTAYAFQLFLSQNNLNEFIDSKLEQLDADNITVLNETSTQIQELIIQQELPTELVASVKQFYTELDQGYNRSYAVRSSATAEDLPDASFAGQQETYLNVTGIDDILAKIKLVYSSLYNARAISYRKHQGFKCKDVSISVGVQMMVRSDLECSGVMFSIDTESGFNNAVFITASYGLGETIVQGSVNPDEYYVFKPTLNTDFDSVIQKTIGSKAIKMIFNSADVVVKTGELVEVVDVSLEERNRFVLTNNEIEELAKAAVIIEQHYACPMDVEWAKDGLDGKFYIVQARPETVQSNKDKHTKRNYSLKNRSKLLLEGRAIGQKIGAGKVKILADCKAMDQIQAGDVLVADMTDPNWEPIMKKASAIITNRGGRTCHAAIIARELGIPAVVGCGNATEKLKQGMEVTVNCADGDTGQIYAGILDIEVQQQNVSYNKASGLNTKVLVNIGNPRLAFNVAQLPNDGVGLARLEFIINNMIGVHPQAILDYPHVDADLKLAVEKLSKGYASPRAFYVEKLTEGIATIAAAFYPKPVIVRMSDFKSNEYKKLIGGSRYEPDEENPMLGFRGAARYVSDIFKEAFQLECQALKYVRDKMGFTNVQIMIPFVRTVAQAKNTHDSLAENGLVRGQNELKLIMMCEIPSNAILAEQFLEYFDGFSIGSNDLTQLTLGLDRDSGIELLAKDFDERNDAVLFLITRAIHACIQANKYVGICGQGPSDHKDFAQWLVDQQITSISLNPDSLIDFHEYFNQKLN